MLRVEKLLSQYSLLLLETVLQLLPLPVELLLHAHRRPERAPIELRLLLINLTLLGHVTEIIEF
jgi:hypothetical protein